MKLLHVDSSITGADSVSRSLTAAIVARLQATDPSLDIITRDLTATPLPHLELTSMAGGESEGALASADILDEFLGADIVVIGAPMYNFSVPSQLKAWIDRLCVAGRTFSYGENGVQGLAGGRRVIIAVSRGNFYSAGKPYAYLDHVESYLTGLFGFIGITPEFVIAEGVMAGPDHRTAALDHAGRAITDLAA